MERLGILPALDLARLRLVVYEMVMHRQWISPNIRLFTGGIIIMTLTYFAYTKFQSFFFWPIWASGLFWSQACTTSCRTRAASAPSSRSPSSCGRSSSRAWRRRGGRWMCALGLGEEMLQQQQTKKQRTTSNQQATNKQPTSNKKQQATNNKINKQQ